MNNQSNTLTNNTAAGESTNRTTANTTPASASITSVPIVIGSSLSTNG
jgi:hypothetical protein